MMVKVGFYTKSTQQSVGGGYSFINTIQGELLGKSDDIEIVLISDVPYYKKDFDIKCISIYNSLIAYTIFRIIRKLCRLLMIQYTNKKRIKRKLQKEHIDIVWIPGPFELDVSIPYIFTVWDIGHRTVPYFPEVSGNVEWEGRERLYKKMLYRASYIITGNETGKKEILENYPMSNEKIKVVPFPNPVQLHKSCGNKPLIEISTPYIFYPAQFWPHKNHISLVETINYLHDNNYRIHCYFAGSDKGNMPYIKNKIAAYHLESHIHILGFVDDDTINYLYRNALALTFVSLMGPNNLPPIEAVSLGCPVIISNIPGHLEQMGDAALAVDAANPKEIGHAVIKLLSDTEFRDALIRKGNELAEKQRNYTYFNEVIGILSDFQKIRKTWR